LCETFLILRRIQRDIITNVRRTLCKAGVVLVTFQWDYSVLVASRIKTSNGVFVQLYPVWGNLNISKEVKIQIFNTDVKSVYYMLVKL